MNELDLLKQVRNDVPDPDPLALARARQRLLAPAPVRRRSGPRMLVAAGLAVTLAGAFLAADVIDHDATPQPGAVADAGTFLAEAAVHAAAQPDVRIPPGQFLQVTTQRTYLVHFGPRKQYRATTFAVEDKWITADPMQQYPGRYQGLVRVDYATPEARRAARTFAPDLLRKPAPQLHRVTCRGLVVQPAINPKILNRPCTPSWSTPTAGFLAARPRDPAALLAQLRTFEGPEKDRFPRPADWLAFARIGAVLDSGIVPADLRAALYRAARMIPGITIQADVETNDGRRGTAVGYTWGSQRSELILAPSTGQSIGSRLVEGNGDVSSTTSFTSRLTSTRPPLK